MNNRLPLRAVIFAFIALVFVVIGKFFGNNLDAFLNTLGVLIGLNIGVCGMAGGAWIVGYAAGIDNTKAGQVTVIAAGMTVLLFSFGAALVIVGAIMGY